MHRPQKDDSHHSSLDNERFIKITNQAQKKLVGKKKRWLVGVFL